MGSYDHDGGNVSDVFASWENCEGGVCCTEATAIIDALVAERDEAKHLALRLNELNGEWKKRVAAEARVTELEAADCCWIGDETCPIHGSPICCGEPMSLRHVDVDGGKSWDCHICTKREVSRLREAVRGKCDCGHIHDRGNGCDDCSCWGWSRAALADKEGT